MDNRGTAPALTGPVANGTATGYSTAEPAPRAIEPAAALPPASLHQLDARKALVELASTTMDQIEQATALTWGGRALASYRLSMAATSTAERLRRFQEGDSFQQEAFEHAAMVEDHALLTAVQDELHPERAMALAAIQALLDGDQPARVGR